MRWLRDRIIGIFFRNFLLTHRLHLVERFLHSQTYESCFTAKHFSESLRGDDSECIKSHLSPSILLCNRRRVGSFLAAYLTTSIVVLALKFAARALLRTANSPRKISMLLYIATTQAREQCARCYKQPIRGKPRV